MNFILRKTEWIPKPNEAVRLNGKPYRVISVNFAGKCILGNFNNPNRTRGRVKDVDVSKVKPFNESR